MTSAAYDDGVPAITGFTFPINMAAGVVTSAGFTVEDPSGPFGITSALFTAPDAVTLGLDRSALGVPVTLSYDGSNPAMIAADDGRPVCPVEGLEAALTGPAPMMVSASFDNFANQVTVEFDRPMDTSTSPGSSGWTAEHGGTTWVLSGAAWLGPTTLRFEASIIGVAGGETVGYAGGDNEASLMGTLLAPGSVAIT
jgi:hypothetical protein